jgi:hydrogenase nickel incorporation protein HypA/HybF
MHELAITRNVIAICVEHAGGARVTRVRLEIGKLSGIMADAVRFCFDVCARGTVVEGARLEIIETPGLAVCRGCGADVPLTQVFDRCGCGGNDLRRVAGEELKVKEMETE